MKELKDLQLKPAAEIAKFSAQALKDEIKNAEKKMYALRMKLASSELKQTHLIKALRRYIAALRTFAHNAK